MYLLDTDILSNALKRAPSPNFIAKLAAVPGDQQFTSSITVGELVYGAHRVVGRTSQLLARIDLLIQSIPNILAFDVESGRRYGALRAELESRGTPLAESDLRIAAIALAHNLTVVTANVRHFVSVQRRDGERRG